MDEARIRSALERRDGECFADSQRRAARDRHGLPSRALIALALERARSHWDDVDESGNWLATGPEMRVLDYRRDDEVVDWCIESLVSDDKYERFVALTILRNLELSDEGESEFLEALQERVRFVLETHARVEVEPELRRVAVQGAFRHCFEEQQEFLEWCFQDEAPGVRTSAAWNLFNAIGLDPPTPGFFERHEALIRRALADEVSDVRWSVVWDVHEHSLLEWLSPDVRADLVRLRDDPDSQIREDVTDLLDGDEPERGAGGSGDVGEDTGA